MLAITNYEVNGKFWFTKASRLMYVKHVAQFLVDKVI